MDEKILIDATEVASRLGIAKNTVYEMVKRGELPSIQIGKKLRFNKSEIDTFLSGTQPKKENKELVISGQDLILDILANRITEYVPTAHPLRLYQGSYTSLIGLYQGEIDVASSHLWDSETNEYNISYAKKLVPGEELVVIHLAKRNAGFYVLEDNPKNLTTWSDLRKDITLINRERGAGARVLLDEHLKLEGIESSAIKGYDSIANNHLSVASAILKGEADVGVGIEKIAKQVDGIDFIPLQVEQYDLVFKASSMNRPEIKAMLEILRSQEFRTEFELIGGYNVSMMGSILYQNK